MTAIQIHAGKRCGSIKISPSKSVMQRVCAAALLYKGTTIIHNPGKSNDDKVALNIIEQLGAIVTINDNNIEIFSNGIHPINNKIDCGESGLSARMFASIIALHDEHIELTGSGSLNNRSLDWFNKVFPQLDVDIKSNQGFLPMQIKGVLQPKNIVVDGSSSSQYLTGLLMAYSYTIQKNISILNDADITIEVQNLNSKPYINLTLQVMQDFGMLVPQNLNDEKFIFNSLHQPINKSTKQQIDYTIEGDWSGAAFFLVLAAIHGNITVKGLQPNSYQADKKIIDVLNQVHANFIVQNNDYVFGEAAELTSFDFDATDSPDLFPPLVALACFCKGISTIKGIHRLSNKESNRAISLQTEFIKFGVKVELNNNTMFIHPTSTITGGIFNSHNDHRIAMACAIVGTKTNSTITIQHANAIDKSYPSFYKDLINLIA